MVYVKSSALAKLKSIALTASFYGLHRAGTASAAGCFDAYASGRSYGNGDSVSATITVMTPIVNERCDTGTTGCVGGFKRTGGMATSETHNYKCTSNIWCSNSVYAPGSANEGLAWLKESAECSGTATTPIPPRWSGGGCPGVYSDGSDYTAGSLVAVNKGSYATVYQCKEPPSDLWCPMDGYKPNESQYWDQAWMELGSCTGTLAPTDAPINVVLQDAGGCPDAYEAAAEYDEGDKVSKDSLVYQCKRWPLSNHCSQAGYEPGVDTGGVEYWMDAWDITGYCSGTVSPTSSPNFVSLPNMGGCSEERESRAAAEPYMEGDRVSLNGLVFECKAWPFSGHCSQAGYEPLVDPAWADAWRVVGFCSGTIGPTASPAFDSIRAISGGCPMEFSSSKTGDYEVGDQVSVVVSTSPERKIVYECRPYPFSGYCNQRGSQLEPGNEFSYLGWTLKGACDGTFSPTKSPIQFEGTCVYKTCAEPVVCTPGSNYCSCSNGEVASSSCTKPAVCDDNTPIEVWSQPNTYDQGDVVRIGTQRYTCRVWPNSGWCKVKAYEPTSESGGIWEDAWELDGTCTTESPTLSPAPSSPPTVSPVPTVSPAPTESHAPTKPPTTCHSIVPISAPASIGVKVTPVGAIPTDTTAASSYNMMVAENFQDKVFFIDQLKGIIYYYDMGSKQVTEIYNINDDPVPEGVDTENFGQFAAFANGINKIHQVAPGPDPDTIIVVFTSATLPQGYPDPLPLPAESQYNLFDDGDCSPRISVDNCARGGNIFGPPYCCTATKAYKLFYKFNLNLNANSISNPELFFAFEMQKTYGHDGGAMLTLSDGKFLFSVGDCLPFGLNGLHAPQDATSHCGKMLLVDSADGSFEIVASGIRNSQQMTLAGSDVVFMDIGGVTAEEVNSVPLASLLDTTTIENFGWGEVSGETFNGESFAREGTFAVGQGSVFGPFGQSPPCLGLQTNTEKAGFILPYLQFGRGIDENGNFILFFAIASVVVPSQGFNLIKVLSTEFNTGLLIAALDDYVLNEPSQGQFVKLYKENASGTMVDIGDFNSLVKDKLSLADDESSRGDARLFRYPDGSAGVFIERTGEFFKLEEITV